MKKLLGSLITLMFYLTSIAQSDYIKPHSLGVSFFFSDFKTASDIRSQGLESVIKQKHLFSRAGLNPGIAIDYLEGLSNHVDFIASLGGSFAKFQNANINNVYTKEFLLEATTSLNFKLLPDKYIVVPFADLGVGASKYLGYYSAFAPVGLGIQIKLFDQSFLLLNGQYRIPVTANASYHFYNSISFVGNLSPKKVKAPEVAVAMPVVVVTDRDGDGVPDSLDECPDVAGPAALHGCPDRDGDGIADKNDKCPDVPGLAKYQGCPIPDTDGDGINDEEDKCPTVAGVARYQGCPVPDTDHDGVNDEEDKCPNEAGPASNSGCPLIDTLVIKQVNEAAKNIYFATGSAKLLAKSNKSLNSIVTIMQNNPSYMIDISGHTDIIGKHDKNMTLSENRAASVKKFLTSKGIDDSRISSKGYGPDKPIASNKTATGRSKNRRVEILVRNF